MQILVDLAKTFYESFEFYYDTICKITGQFALLDEERVSAQAIEVWTTLAEEECERLAKDQPIKGYIAQGQTNLVQLLLTCIQKITIEDEDAEDDEWGVALSSGCCLKAISMVIKNDVIPPVISFVEANIGNQNWKLRYSSLLALGAITEGPDRQHFISLIQPALQTILNLFVDQHAKVKEAAGWMISKICEFHAESLIPVMNMLVEAFVRGL